MEPEYGILGTLGRAGQLRQRQGRDIGRVIGRMPRPFERSHVGEIGHRGGRAETRNELREADAVAEQHGRAGRLALDIDAGHGAEELIAHEARNHRETAGQHLDQAGIDIVAVDAEAAALHASRFARQRRRHRSLPIEHRAREVPLQIGKRRHDHIATQLVRRRR